MGLAPTLVRTHNGDTTEADKDKDKEIASSASSSKRRSAPYRYCSTINSNSHTLNI